MRLLSIGISTITIPIMYGLARKFFSSKYSLVASCLLAFEPHLNYIAGQGLSEPLYILALILSFYFILDKKTSYLSFLFAGLLWWVRWPGMIMVLVISLIFFLNNNRSLKLFLQYLLCIAIFLAVVSPMLIHRYEQYGDFMYFSLSNNFFSGDYGTLLAENTKSESYTVKNYIENYGLLQFTNDFVLTGIANIADQVFRMLFPYLIVLIPFGILFSFRAFDQNPKHIRANWILIIVTLCGSVLSFSLINERRFLFYLYPFLVLFCTIPIQRLTQYGLSTFSYSERQKDFFLLGMMIIILIMSILFAQRYIQDSTIEDEKMKLAEFLLTKSDGKIILSNEDWRHGTFLKASNPEFFKDFTIDYKKNNSINELIGTPFTTLYAKSLEELLTTGQQYNLKYVVIVQNDIEPWYGYLNNVYKNESEYPYLIKIYDSSEQGLQKLHAKVFEIDYEKWASYKNTKNQ
jgi:4-amino-4-deoxy-L-arabinose transferase-like glycosyltransferase